MNSETHRDLALLDAVAADQQVTQRTLAARLGIALGLTNIYLKRLARKGFIKCVNVRRNRILYFITPQGIAEKTRLTYEFMSYSLGLYREVRGHLRKILEPLARNGATKIAIYGEGEAAELAYLSLKELGLEPAAIFGKAPTRRFLGMPVRDLRHAEPADFDYLVLACLESPSGLSDDPNLLGIPKEKLLLLRPN
jgi:DNA-binding MarR family transcriptional regulator